MRLIRSFIGSRALPDSDFEASDPGSYLLRQHLLIHDQAITVRGEGVGLSKLIWAEDAASIGLVICQGAQQNDQTDFTRVQHLSFYTKQKDVGEG